MRVAIACLALVVATGAWLIFRSDPAPPRETAPVVSPPKPDAAPPPEVKPASAEVVVQPPRGSKPTGPAMLYPDGNWAPALNGVTAPVRIGWDWPYSPIVRKVVDRGWEWYVHEDGSHSTSRMVTMNGVEQAMGLVAKPTQALPVLDDAALQAMMSGGK